MCFNFYTFPCTNLEPVVLQPVNMPKTETEVGKPNSVVLQNIKLPGKKAIKIVQPSEEDE